jgi:Fe-S cluster assembly protein SufD
MNAYALAYQDLLDGLPGRDLPWLEAKRRAALSQFAGSGFPSPREEEWRYTNVAPIEKKLFKPAIAAANEGTEIGDAVQALHLNDAWVFALVDGRFSPAFSRLEGLPESVKVISLVQALNSQSPQVEKHFGQALAPESHGFIAYNTAYFTDGVCINVPKGVVLDRPIQIAHFVSSPDVAAITRNLIVLGESAQSQVVETFAGHAGHGYLSAAVTEVVLGDNAGFDSYRLQCESEKAYHFSGLYVLQGRDSRCRQHNLAFGGLLARAEIHSELSHGSECTLNGLFLARGRQHLDNHTLIQHKQPHATSSETYRGVLADRARGVFQGRIVVHPQAQKSQADMSNRNLLLSEDAEIDTKPQLEILADDVKCSHGVTVGQLNPESVFYLASRGVDEASARNMLTFAFANEMVERIDLEPLKQLAQQQLLVAFPQSGIRRDWL